MVLNLLQRFSLDEAKELILKSFGYFSSGSRLKPLFDMQVALENEAKERSFVCPFKYTDEQLFEYDKIRHIYVQNRQTYKKICKQERAKNRPLPPEAVQFGKDTKAMLERLLVVAVTVTAEPSSNVPPPLTVPPLSAVTVTV